MKLTPIADKTATAEKLPYLELEKLQHLPELQLDKSPLVLIVEDDVTMEPLWSYIIEEINPRAQIKWATTEEAAERMMEQQFEQGRFYDLVIADVFLSGHKTGIDLWRRFGEGPTAFLLISVMGPEKLARMTGVNEPLPPFIQKPLNPTDCIEKIKELLDNGVSA